MGRKHCMWVPLMLTLTAAALAQDMVDGPIVDPAADQDTYILYRGDNITLYCNGRSNVTWTRQTAISQVEEGGFTFNIYPEEPEGDYASRVALDLVNVNEHTVGYYACHHDHVLVDLNDIMEEPKHTEDVTYIYIYVNGTKSSFADMRTTLIVPENAPFVVPCRPTVPDIKIKLLDASPLETTSSERYAYNPKIGFVVEDDSEMVEMYMCDSHRDKIIVTVSIQDPTSLETPELKLPTTVYGGEEKRKLIGETLVMNCTVVKIANVPVKLEWTVPNGEASKGGRYSKQTNTKSILAENVKFYTSFELRGVTKEDEGVYTCTATYSGKDGLRSNSTYISILDAPILKLTVGGDMSQTKISGKSPTWRITLHEPYPLPNITIFKNEREQIYPNKNKTSKYRVDIDFVRKFNIIFSIRQAQMEDTGNYTIVASNGLLTSNVTVHTNLEEVAKVAIGVKPSKRYLKDVTTSIPCEVTGNPLPEVLWQYEPDCENQFDCQPETITQTNIRPNRNSPYAYTSILPLKVQVSGNLTCFATNTLKTNNNKNSTTDAQTISILVYEIENGFGIDGGMEWFARDSDVWLSCVASKYDYVDEVKWYRVVGDARKKMDDVVSANTALSYVRKMHIKKAALEHSGMYECEARRNDGYLMTKNHTITVEDWRNPTLRAGLENGERVGKENLELNLNCTAEGVPRPTIRWFHNGMLMEGGNETHMENTVVLSSLVIHSLQEQDLGRYECVATGGDGGGETKTYVDVIIKNKGANKAIYLSIIGIIVVVFLILICYLVWKIKREKEFRKNLYRQFNEGNTGSLNPELAVDEQADLLPYNKKFEFPQDKLILRERLGEGAFGEVYKAEARGIIDAEVVTIVAVKKVKRDAESLYVNALISELKIMIHMGKHLNILNLLGACTKKIARRELLVILEYCKFGNIHNYLQKHREVFIDQLMDTKEQLGDGQFNRGFSRSSANSGDHSEYFGSEHTPVTGHTMVNSAGTSAALRTGGSEVELLEFVKGSESEYVQPKWRSNYQSDYVERGSNLRPLYSRDLICWAFQIARGMEYLASRKVLHGDLAARNILLAEDNVVKICDFGLARSIQKNDVYQKQSNDPVPVKWLALECMKSKTFSTQSDVWSFGVVLWELFSLGRTPYPGLSPQDLFDKLSAGYRLEKPRYANEALHSVMQDCWLKKPVLRPSFTILQLRLGQMLEENVRNHYVDLNSPYMASNEAWRAMDGAKDYLDMVQAPEYRHDGSVSTPTPTYQNQAFFPQPATDDDGYLQVSPSNQQAMFSHRANGDMFSFDARRNPRAALPSERAANRNELTPMLPAAGAPRGSDSDHEGSHSPYLRMKPACIAEEEDDGEVFSERAMNLRNNNAAVHNPSYNILTIDADKKKPEHGYLNIIPNNGLVK